MAFGAFSSEPRGRYEQVDSEEQNLPPGTQRVGYDADTQVYTYQEPSGALFNQPKYSTVPINSKKERSAEWRYLAPFILIIGIVLLGTFRYVNTSSSTTHLECLGDLELYDVVDGDTCYDIAQARQTDLDGLKVANPWVRCEGLKAGSQICAPKVGTMPPVSAPVSSPVEEGKEEGGERLGHGGPRPQCWQIMCNPYSGGDAHCKAEGCGKGCSSRSSKCEA
ncbi:hypothetical protein CLAFUW4_07238 [Fulvia fulva]|uniref:LysM domain-containing protein n=1 Tax=Passalora fulva TaxID=5499 RepID=A0A9Q8PAB5_PASFU|nr:uncharacterized protein CLAFUR5_07370 [Fulvia fulva]KAK4621515.1 hypothetical protein CLAFUR4_07246 [Fulvia fulva]KAK4623045.1 hypothetical protein CLAFUR0_07243 [Fulvia fulva]UJO18813.1 hypothetical protein CLAFUR5_07370 [Fulvia fulva]WPV16714.1 hypothetical protein CLAFUW4_07238 [Fulvia fulva]WPV31562.1 hypothetical protein CLAFUW7_07239 [Fulvia fulva]